MMQHRIVTCS